MADTIYSKSINFEKTVINTLSQYISGDEALLVPYKVNRLLITDFWFPNGFAALEWPPKTAVEVKYNLMPDTIYRLYEKASGISRKDIQCFVVISEKTIPQELTYNQNSFKTYSFSEIKKKLELSSSKRADKRTSGSEVSIANKETVVEKAKNYFKQGRNTFFLGAGVSMDAHLPSWGRLLEAALKLQDDKPFRHINEANSEAISIACGHSTIITGRYICGKETDDSKYLAQRIKSVLYEGKTDSELVRAICDAIATKSVDSVITYNYDDLIESELDNRPDVKYRSVCNKDFHEDRMCIPIFHVHGMITENRKIESTPILSEKEYHNLYKYNHNWANVTQLYALNTSTCYFIGLSMTDPNLRRLLDFSRQNDDGKQVDLTELPHFVFLRQEKLKGEASNRANKEHWKEMEHMMAEFGLNIIWYKDFKEIPALIREIASIS